MSEKKFNARIVHKHDIEANWLKATNFIPKQGEIIIYDIDTNYTYERMKIGDGKTVVSSLPFADANKVDKVAGKGLSTNDYTTTEKNKLADIAEGANKTIVDSALSSTSINPVQNKVVNTAISNLNTLVGDKSVSSQIETALTGAKEYTDQQVEALVGGDFAVSNAEHASTADNATHATSADKATQADNATTAGHAATAGHANTASSANTASHATTADSATNANHATTADTATTAGSATKATQDGSGNVITTTYETKVDAASKLTEAKGYTDSEIDKWVGDQTVATQIETAIEELPQADWNQNDETASDYVKNRTHYSEYKEATEYIVKDFTFTCNHNDDLDVYYFFIDDSNCIEKLSNEYIVIFNGVEYTCTPSGEVEDGNIKESFGNESLIPAGGADTGEPFYIEYECYPDEEYAYLMVDCLTEGPHTITIYTSGIKEIIYPIDKKYLSELNIVGWHGNGQNAERFNNYFNIAEGDYSHAEGGSTEASGDYSHAEGNNTYAGGDYSHAEGNDTHAVGIASHSEGYYTYARGDYSHAEGYSSNADGYGSHAEGNSVVATTNRATYHTNNTDAGFYGHSEGYGSVAYGAVSHAEGNGTNATGVNSHSEGYRTIAAGQYSHAEGYKTRAATTDVNTTAVYTDIGGYAAHSEGYGSVAYGAISHAEGNGTKASGQYSHSEGFRTIAAGTAQHVQGRLNIEDINSVYAHIIGNGDIDRGTLSNAHTLDWDGNAWFAGDVYVGSTSGTNKDDGSKKLASEEYVDTSVANLVNSAPETLDTLGELATAFTENQDVVEALDEAITTKADKSEVTALSNLVGDTSVAAQIETAIEKMPQSDWNQNDAAAKDYIKNRPFYEEGGFVEVLPATTLTMEYNPDEGTSTAVIEGKLELQNGVEYTIMWNGTEYQCTAVEVVDGDVTSTALGAIGIITGVDCTDCPFIILPIPSDEGVWATIILGLGEYTQITISIAKGGIKKLDNKFLDLEWLPITVEKEIFPLTEYTEQINEIPIEFDELIKYKEAIIYCDGGRYVWPIVHEHRELDTDCGIYLMTAPTLEASKCVIQVPCNNFSSQVGFMTSGAHTLSISVPVANTIPEKFLPSKMPTSEDITQMFMEMGVLQPVSDENNVVYTDTDGKTFIL